MLAKCRRVLPPDKAAAIESLQEHPIPFGDVAMAFGVERRTVKHWFAVGLEHTGQGRQLCTSQEALHRFATANSPLFLGERNDVSHLLESLANYH